MNAKGAQVELSFANTMHELDPTNCDGSGSEAFQAKHGAQPGLYVAMVLLDQIVQVFRRAKLRQFWKRSLLF